MAPTTLVGQRATTAPEGRRRTGRKTYKDVRNVSAIDGAAFVERVSVHNVPNIRKAKRAIRKAFEVQLAGEGFSIVEVLSTCPTNWGLAAPEAMKWLEENMIPYYPLGNFRMPKGGK